MHHTGRPGTSAPRGKPCPIRRTLRQIAEARHALDRVVLVSTGLLAGSADGRVGADRDARKRTEV